MIRGETSGALGLHFGKDMWRAYGTMWCWVLYTLVSWLGFFLSAAVAGWAGGMVFGQSGGLFAAIVAIAYVIVWFVITVRAVPATATTIAIGKFDPLKAFAATRGRFWALFGSFLLLFVLYLIFSIIATGVQFSLFFGPALAEVNWSGAASDPTTFSQEYNRAIFSSFSNMFASPGLIAAYLGFSIIVLAVGMMFYALFFGVSARAAAAALEEGKIEPAA